jgi:hypothetical protein
MKEVVAILSVLAVLLAPACSGRKGSESGGDMPVADTGKARMIFREYEHHFGKVEAGEKVSWQFVYENKGTGDLVIKNVATTCGCTVSKFDRKPLKPGGSGKIEVIFDTKGRQGMQTKTISVMSNDMMPVILLKITAEVQANK